MSRSTYTPIVSYTGAGNQSAYTFSFKITALIQILIVEYTAAGVENQRVRGDDVTYLSSVTFDAQAGAGTVNLAANLASGRILKIMLADDAPTQPQEYRSKFAFSLRNFENALDFITGAITRNSYLALRSIKLPDFLLLSNFDPTLPIEMTDAVSRTIVTNAAGTGLIMGPTVAEIEAAEANAIAAAASQAAASTSETNAASSASGAASSASAAAASAASMSPWSAFVTHAITGGQGETVLTDETVDGAVYSTAPYEFEIIRGTTIIANGRFSLQYFNSTWRLVTGSYEAEEVHGVTFTVTQAGSVGTVNAAVNAGSSGEIKLSRMLISV